ncbi:MAG: esterase/lipase family protein [Nitrospirales bacterium]
MTLDECIESGEPFLRESDASERGLVVFVHGFLLQPRDHAPLLKKLAEDEAFLHDDILPFQYESNKWSNRDPKEIAEELATQIHTLWLQRQPKRLFVLAHSMGGLLARAALVHGLRKGHPWAKAVTRLCLLESTNRGYRPHRLWHKIQLFFARKLGVARLARSVLVGSRFVVRVRLDWLDTFAPVNTTPPESRAGFEPGSEKGPDSAGATPESTGTNVPLTPPPTIQLLAHSKSRPVVFGDDSDDLLTCGRAEQRRIPHVNHYTIAMLPPESEPDTQKYIRFDQIKAALFDPLTPTSVETKTYPAVKLVTFIVHGIRDYGKWLSTLETEIKAIDPEAKVWKKRYPYFSILNFLRRTDRLTKVNGLVEEYGDHRVVYPNATFVCCGHSNGTYLLGHAMLEFPGVRFKRVFLAGSVLPQEFDWRTIGIRNQVQQVRNDMANADVPVGFLCAALSSSPFHRDLGIGGFRGFTKRFAGTDFHETEWVDGGHGAAIEPTRLPNVASYLVKGTPVKAENPVGEVKTWLAWVLKFAKLWGAVITLLVIGIGVFIIVNWPFPGNLLPFAAYLFVVILLLARV